MKFFLCFLCLALCLCCSCHKNDPTPTETEVITFVKTFGGGGWDDGREVKETADGGYIICGNTYGIRFDIFLVKTDSMGNEIWSRKIDEQYRYNNHPESIATTEDGGYIIVGSSNDHPSGSDRYTFALKTDSRGEIVWNHRFNDSKEADLYSIQNVSNDKFIMCGTDYSLEHNRFEFYLAQITGHGTLEWEKTISDELSIVGFEVHLTNDSGFIISGARYSDNESSSDMLLVKIDSEGILEWKKWYNLHKKDLAYSVVQTQYAGFVIVGTTIDDETGYYNVCAIKTDDQGNVVWSNVYGDIGGGIAYSVVETDDNHITLCGFVAEYETETNSNFLILNLNSDGEIVWEKNFDYATHDHANDIRLTKDGGYIACGETGFGSITYGYADLLLIKTDEEGNVSE